MCIQGNFAIYRNSRANGDSSRVNKYAVPQMASSCHSPGEKSGGKYLKKCRSHSHCLKIQHSPTGLTFRISSLSHLLFSLPLCSCSLINALFFPSEFHPQLRETNRLSRVESSTLIRMIKAVCCGELTSVSQSFEQTDRKTGMSHTHTHTHSRAVSSRRRAEYTLC